MVLGTLVWPYLTIRELGCLTQVSRFVRDQIETNEKVVRRLVSFLKNGLRVLELTANITRHRAPLLRLCYQRNIERIIAHQSVLLYPTYNGCV